MSGTSQPTFFSATCTHTPIDDYFAGVCVCSICGLVLEEQLLLPSVTQHTHTFPLIPTDKHDVEMETFLRDVCDRAHICTSLIFDTLVYARKVKDHLQKKRFSTQEIVACALYHTLNAYNSSRTLADIARYSGVQQSRVCAIEATIPSTAAATMDNIVDGYCVALGIPFFHSSIIKKNIISNTDELEALQPQTIISAVIYIYSKKVKLDLTMKEICNVCQVSSPNVHKIVRRLNKMHTITFSFFDVDE
jgi:transcription initiation factor TFIIIB Brf1 subunit/transcription initiation factor TFIIB